MKDVAEKHKKEILSILLWKTTEVDGKWSTRYISEGVLKLNLNGKYKKGIEHEHVFTRKTLILELLENPKKSNFIIKKAIGCLVTKEEHNKLNKVKNLEGWERYKKVNIKVYDTKSKKWLFA